MAAKTLSEIVGGGGGAGIRLAPDLGFMASRPSALSQAQTIFGIDTTAGLTEVLSLSGKFALDSLSVSGFTAAVGALMKLTIDGVVIYDSDAGPSSNQSWFVGTSGGQLPTLPVVINSSLSLEYNHPSDNNITVSFIARPIL